MARRNLLTSASAPLVHNSFDNLARIGKCKAPIFLAHGRDDPAAALRQRATDMAADEAAGAGDEDRPQRRSSGRLAASTSSTIRRCCRSSASVPLRSSRLSAELNSDESAPRFSFVRSASSGSIGRMA